MHRVDAVGNSPGVHREHVEGIGSLPGWRKGVPQKKIETRQKIVGRFGLHPTKIDSGRRCASRKRTRE
ncbi:hypothetical protein GW17_00043980 [Ensete ventricosum]|nr:hypothetical protein GW17_00043980 [Ensete ventricosum]